jgi:hypothetical protein
MSTEPVSPVAPAALPYDDIVARAKANSEAAAAAKAQTEIYTAVATERGIQCQKAHEIIDLWFATWEPSHALQWKSLSGDQRPSVGAAMALIETCLGYAPDHEDKAPAEEPPPVEPQAEFGVAPHEQRQY